MVYIKESTMKRVRMITSKKLNHNKVIYKPMLGTNTGSITLNAIANDTFVNSNRFKIGFKESNNKSNTEKRLLELQKNILRLKTSVMHPKKFLYGEGQYILDALETGKSIPEILSHYSNNVLDHLEYGKPVKQHIKDYCNIYNQIKPMLKEVNDLKTNLPRQEIPNSLKTYLECAKRCNAGFRTPNGSTPFRYMNQYIQVMELMEDNLKKGKKTNFLVVGLGEKCEDAYDYSLYSLMSAKRVNQNLSDSINMQLVDCRPKKDFDFDYCHPIVLYTKNNFVHFKIQEELIDHPDFPSEQTYPLEVLEFVEDLKHDNENFHHSRLIEDFVDQYRGEGFDFLAINNVIQYPGIGELTQNDPMDIRDSRYKFLNPFKSKNITDQTKFECYRQFLEKVFKMVKPGGLISCELPSYKESDILYSQLSQISFIQNEFEYVLPNMFRRKVKR